jgi:hypothetical protein
MASLPQQPDLTEARRLLAAGFKLVPLLPFQKRPARDEWNKPENFATQIDDRATGYGMPLAVNGLCSVDPDHYAMAKVGVAAWGFDLDELLAAGVRTGSTRPDSGGRAAFRADDHEVCRWLTFKVFDENGIGTTVLELRAKSANLQDCVPGIVYAGAGGEQFTQTYANCRRFDQAPALPEEFAKFWRWLSVDDAALREHTEAFAEAIRNAGFTLGEKPVRYLPPMGSGKELPFPAPKIRGPFNRATTVESILTRHGYGYCQRSRRWYRPGATGAPGIRPIPRKDDLWQSDHGGDPLHGTFDAWAAHVVLDHGGNVDAAIAAWNEAETARGGSNEPPHGISNEQDTPFDLSQFSLRGEAASMEARMLDDKFILGRLAILGQSTAFYAKPNAGKTLLTIWLLIEAIRSGEIDGDGVFYVNADDNHKGLTQKLKLAEREGFHMLAPGYKGFKPQHLGAYLAKLVEQDAARGKVLILDTVKKFTDIMDKKRGSDFGEVVRQFVSHGGSVIMLAHTNKHRDGDGKLVHAGTSDIVDDADCAYMLDVIETDAQTGERTVMFENFKSRGDVVPQAVYRYDASQGVTYYDRLKSVTAVSDDERRKVEARSAAASRLEKNRDAVDTIKEVLREGVTLKSEIVDEANERSGIGKNKLRAVLKAHTGSDIELAQYWTVDVSDKNAHHYKLHPILLITSAGRGAQKTGELGTAGELGELVKLGKQESAGDGGVPETRPAGAAPTAETRMNTEFH